MITIRNLNILDIKELKNLKNFLREDYSEFKFQSDSYAAISENNITGMISLCSKRNNKHKWKIKDLMLKEESLETGKQLIDYVVTKYASKGVETFEVEISPDNDSMLDLFSKSCGFRYCLDYQLYNIKTDHYKGREIDTQNVIFRPFKDSDKKEVADLYNQNISPYYKFSLSKIPEEFSDNLFKGLSKNDSIKYILEDKYTKIIKGFINILTEDNKNFILELILLQSFEIYFDDMITFAISQITKRTNNFSLFFKNCKFHLNSEIFEKTLSTVDNELVKTDMILVKDFFKQIKDEDKIKNSAIIYPEINGKPAYKI